MNRRIRSISRGVGLGLALTLLASSSYAQGQDSKVPLPKAFAAQPSINVSPAFGSISENIPIVASPGRRGIEPRLVLAYSSNGGPGDAGLGWSVPIGHVERWRGDGTPVVGPPDRFGFSLPGAGGELLNVGDGVYRSKFESTYREFRRTEDGLGWEMLDGQGTLHRFGSTPATRIEGQFWLLDLAKDGSGNTITYSYENVSGRFYPTVIRYTGHEPTGDPGSNRVEFEYEERPDVRTSFRNGFRELHTRRIHRISVYAGQLLTRRYELIYEQSLVNGLSRLSQVDLIGSDDASRITLRKLVYGTRVLGWHGDPATGTLPLDLADDEGNETGVRVIDVNGDGFADVVGNGTEVYLGDGTGSFSLSDPWSESLQAANVTFVEEGIDTGVRLIDVNSDVRPDILIATPSRTRVWLNTGHGWTLDAAWTASLDAVSANALAFTHDCVPRHCDGAPEDSPGCTPAHCTGAADDPADCVPPHCSDKPDDCLPDHCDGTRRSVWSSTPWIQGGTDELGAMQVLRPGGPPLPADCVPVHCSEDSVVGCVPDHCEGNENDPPDCLPIHCSDFPEDCLPDHCEGIDNPFSQPVFEQFSLVDKDGRANGAQLTDINGDGRVDIFWSMKRTKTDVLDADTPVRVRDVFLNNGSGWDRSAALSTALANLDPEFTVEGQSKGYSVIDINADGLADIVRAIDGETNGQQVLLGTGNGWTAQPDEDYTQSIVDNGIFSLNEEQEGQGIIPVDFNDDGLLDYFRAKGDQRAAFVNTGTEWVPSPEMELELLANGVSFATEDGKANGTVVADIDGDGIVDLVVSKPDEHKIVLSSTLRAGLMVRATNTLGSVADVQWESSTRFPHTQPDGVEGLPTTMPVVTKLSRDYGRGRTFSTTFEYDGGLFEDRQFRGFAHSLVIPSVGLDFLSSYHQHEQALIGQAEVVEAYDKDGKLRLRSTTLFEVVAVGPVQQIMMLESEEESFDDGAKRHSRVVRTYDDRLMHLSILRDPEVATPGDEKTTTFTWVRNNAAGIWNLPSRSQVIGPNGTLLTDNMTFYDGLPHGQAAVGLPTESRDMVEPGKWVSKEIEYNEMGNATSLRDRAGHLTTFGYDETATFREYARDPEGLEVRSKYDPCFGALVRDENASGNVLISEYDAFGRLVHTRLPGEEASSWTKSYTFSPLGDPETQFYRYSERENFGEPETFDTTSFFEGDGLIYRREQDGSEGRTIVTLFEFDAAGEPAAVSNDFFAGETPIMSSTERDDQGRPTVIIGPDGIPNSMAYVGHEIHFVSKLGIPSSLRMNGDGDITEVREWNDNVEQVTRYTYDVLGRLTAIVDAIGSETRLFYDGLGRRTRLEDPSAGSFEYEYDDEGRLIEMVGPDGKSTFFDYDHNGALIRKTFPDGTFSEFAYGSPGDTHAAGELVRVTDASGVLSLRYDARGNIIERVRSVLDRTYVMGFAYDALDRVSGIAYPDGFIVRIAYDSGNTVSSVTDGGGRELITDVSRNAQRQIEAIGYGNGVRSDYAYDNLSRMTSLRTATSLGEALQSLDYSYDAHNNIVSIADSAFQASQTFGYDTLDRLVSAEGAYGTESYDYDAIGNLLRKGSLVFDVDPLHPQRVIHVTDTAGRGQDRDLDIEYDVRGNATRKGDLRFQYDAENRMVRATGSQGRFVSGNIYDAGGQRIIQITPSHTTVFIDGLYEEGQTHASRHVRVGPMLIATSLVPVARVTLIEEVDWAALGVVESGGLGTSGWILVVVALVGIGTLSLVIVRFGGDAWQRRLEEVLEIGVAVQRRPGKAGIISLLIFSQLLYYVQPALAKPVEEPTPPPEKIFYYHANHLGSINVVTNGEGRVTSRREYKPFGDPVDWTGPQSGPRELLTTFGGHRFDDSTGFYYLGARHYDPQTGRFLTADTRVTDPYNVKTLHRYAFTGNNPIRYVDPDGHGFWSWFGDAVNAVVTFISDNADILILIGAVVLIIAIVAIAAATGGVALALIAVGAALIGGSIAAGVALAAGHQPDSLEFWQAVATGALLGAAIGAAAGVVAMGALSASLGGAAGSLTVGQLALFGAGFGAVDSTIAHMVGGGEPEDLLGAIVFGTGLGLLLGAVTGAGAVKIFARNAGRAASSIGRLSKIGFFFLRPGPAMTGTKLVITTVASWSTGEPTRALSPRGIIFVGGVISAVGAFTVATGEFLEQVVSDAKELLTLPGG